MEKEKILNPARSLCLEQLYHILVKSQTELDIEQGWQEDSPASLVNLLYNDGIQRAYLVEKRGKEYIITETRDIS